MATFRVCCNSSERRSVPGTSGCAVAASASALRGKGLRISSDRDLCHAHGSWSGSGVGNPRVTPTEEPDGGNLLVRIWRGAGAGNLPAYSTAVAAPIRTYPAAALWHEVS